MANTYWKVVPKLCLAYFAMRLVQPFASQQMLWIIYFSYFHSIMSYGLIFWGHSPHSVRVFRLQKRIIIIMTGSRSRDSCRTLFICLKILPLPSLYIFLLLRFVIKTRICSPQMRFISCIPVGHGVENVSWILFLHRVESGIVNCTLKERSSYSWLGPGGVWYSAGTITVFGKTDLYCSWST